MSNETLFQIAYEMLQLTNEFRKSVDEIKYTSTDSECEEVIFTDLVREKTKKYDHRYRGKSDSNLLRAYEAIVSAMSAYIEDLPVTFSFKQITKKNFKQWLERIRKSYGIPNQPLPDELNPNKELDTGVALLKLLHSRQGVTYADIQDELEIGIRAIQKNLVKLSPQMYAGNGDAYTPFRLGGQKLEIDVELVKPTEKAKEKRFYTRNTIHPLVLQENIMQLATLLKALSHQYYDFEDNISVMIAIDIWSQMSSYAQRKIDTYFTFSDPDFKAFIEILKDECPDDHICSFHTERQMLNEVELPVEQALEYLAKAGGRTGILVFEDNSKRQVKSILSIENKNGNVVYTALDSEGVAFEFTDKQVQEVNIL